jgi:hypothetical protein
MEDSVVVAQPLRFARRKIISAIPRSIPTFSNSGGITLSHRMMDLCRFRVVGARRRYAAS